MSSEGSRAHQKDDLSRRGDVQKVDLQEAPYSQKLALHDSWIVPKGQIGQDKIQKRI